MSNTIALASAALLLTAAPPVMATPATGSFMLKDPYIAAEKAGELFFGARHARDYLEAMPDGTRWPLARADDHVRLSDQWTYVTLGAWAVTLAYGMLIPAAGKDFWNNNAPSSLRGFVGTSLGLTLVDWTFQTQLVASFFRRETVQRNQEIGRQDREAPPDPRTIRQDLPGSL